MEHIGSHIMPYAYGSIMIREWCPNVGRENPAGPCQCEHTAKKNREIAN